MGLFSSAIGKGERKLFLIGLADKGPIFAQGPSFPIIVV